MQKYSTGASSNDFPSDCIGRVCKKLDPRSFAEQRLNGKFVKLVPKDIDHMLGGRNAPHITEAQRKPNSVTRLQAKSRPIVRLLGVRGMHPMQQQKEKATVRRNHVRQLQKQEATVRIINLKQ